MRRSLEWLTATPARAVSIVAGLTVIGALVVALATGIPRPGVADEFAYLLAADTFSSGRLTNPTHPLWEHFENYYILHQPTYSSKFPPGQGLLLAVGQLLGHPVIGVWLGAALMVTATLWMLLAWVPPRWALFGAVLTALLFGIAGVWVQSYMPGTLAATGGALVYGGLRRVLREPRWQDSALLGLGVMLLALSRPYEGVLASIPAALILAVWFARHARTDAMKIVRKVVLPVVVVLAIGAAWTLLHNRAVTGDPLTLPYQAQHELYPIIPIFAWQDAEKGHEYRHWFFTKFERNVRYVLLKSNPPGFHWKTFKWRFRRFRSHFLPAWTWIPLLLLPLALRDRWTVAALGVCLFVWAGQMLTVPMLAHYLAPIVCLMALLTVQCVRVVERVRRPRALVPLTVGLVLALFAHSTLAKARTDNGNRWQSINVDRPRIERQLTESGGRHVVLVRYGPKYDIHYTWVYNSANIDDQPVIWANDMGSWRNARLQDHYPEHQFWLLSLGFGASEDEPPILTPYTPDPEDRGVRRGELPEALQWLAEHPESRATNSVLMSLASDTFDSRVVPGNAGARAFRVSPDLWSRGSAPAAVTFTNPEAREVTPRLRLAVHAPPENLPIEVTIDDGPARQTVRFDRRGVQDIQLSPVSSGESALLVLYASAGWSPKGSERVLGVQVVSADFINPDSASGPDAIVE